MAGKMKFKIVKPCIDQDTKKRLKPGEFYSFHSDFERGRHLAEGNAVPVNGMIEQAVSEPTEKRVIRRRRKKTT